MHWTKHGLVFGPNTELAWCKTHAQVPTVDKLSKNVWRVYYSCRDETNKSRISYFDIEACNPKNVLYQHDSPIMELGNLGTFDDSGMMPSSIVTVGKTKYLYYTGWNERKSVPYQNAIGVAVSQDDGQTFHRLGEGPVLGITLSEPYFIGTSTVLYEDGRWRNWYAACTGWEMFDGKAEPRYHLKYAESSDGIHWERKGLVAIDYRDKQEGGLVRASVVREDGLYRMWYSRRGNRFYRTDREHSYRIGYAESDDGIYWRRCDEQAGIDISAVGWDSEMIAYPCVVLEGKKSFMFYNGNGFGHSGIGYASRTSAPKR
jgi:hypothetical protein